MAVIASEIAPPVTANNATIDNRLVKITIEINGRVKTYQNIFISAIGVKYANPLQDEAEITLYNLDRATQDYILTETSPYNANFTPKTVTIEAGRESYGTTVIYKGNIIYSGITQPPDIGITLRCLSGNYLKSLIISRTQPGNTTLSQLTEAIAQDTNVRALFQAEDKIIANYNFAGASIQQLELLAAMGQLDVYIDGDTLVVKNAGQPLRGPIKDVSAATGMIGIPEFTQRGLRVKFFIDNKTVLGGAINVKSEMYPASNGVYVIYQLAFIITNRLTPFYYVADCIRLGTVSEQS